jgi:hypothetical protein
MIGRILFIDVLDVDIANLLTIILILIVLAIRNIGLKHIPQEEGSGSFMV